MPPPVQRKPTVSSPDDPFEREADEMADKVMRMAEPTPVGTLETQAIQTQRAPSGNMQPPLNVGTAVRATERGGEPLPQTARDFFEPRFGQDFSQVRIHADSEAAHAVHARAYTLGQDIVFNPSEYAPETGEGRRLLAHELTHVVQQRQSAGAAQAAVVQRKPADAAEATEAPTPHSQWVVKTPQGGNLLLRVVADHPTELSDGTPNTVGNLNSGTVVEVIEKKNDLGWYQVTGEVGLDGGLREKRTGFVHRKHLFPVVPTNPEAEKKTPDNPSPAETPADEKLAPVVDEVIQWENYVDPEASGGIGDFAKAFGVLKPLDMQALLAALVKLDARFMLELLYGNIGAAPEADRSRVAIAIMAVLARRGKRVGRGDGPAFFKALNPSDQTTLKAFASTIDAHWQTILFEGEQQEIDRLAGLQQQFLEDKRKAQEAALRKQQEAEAQANSAPPPAPEAAPKVGIGQIIEQEVSSRELKPIPTKVWDDLSDKDKNEVWPKRASTAFDNIRASLKGTELEHVMDGHGFVFEPRKILERGAYAYQSGTDLVCGMTFVKDAESDPKNVWPIVAHEIGGHAAYGSTYAKKIMNKFLASLPEAEQQKWTQDKATGFFDAFMYAETEIFSALRQRRYDVPESGPAPVHGGMKPDANIEARLQAIDQAFPKEVGRAILLELNERVKADTKILDRDKKIFVEQAKKHGYSL